MINDSNLESNGVYLTTIRKSADADTSTPLVQTARVIPSNRMN